MNAPLPKKFSTPKLEFYDGTIDSSDHLRHYHHVMALKEGSQAVVCQTFPTSLKKAALTWFHSLLPRSIDSFQALAKAFITRFVGNQRIKKDPHYLLSLKQKPNETLREHVIPFDDELNMIDGCINDTSITTFTSGLRGGQFYNFLTLEPATNMADLLQNAPKYITLEEMLAAKKGEDPLQDFRNQYCN